MKGGAPAAASSSPQAEGSPSGSPSRSLLPAEARGLQWPDTFHTAAKGERLELSEDGALATRTSGVGFGTALVGPLSLERGTAYFEVEVAELEPKRSQTMAIGVLCAPPPSDGKVARVERARDIGPGSFLLGYDLPKVYANGAEVAKIAPRQWRPLKELAQGDIVGVLIQRASMELTVFVNGERRASAVVGGEGAPSPSQRWPNDVWGIIDVHGNVRAARLRGPAIARQKRQLTRADTVLMPPPEASKPSVPRVPQCWSSSPPPAPVERGSLRAGRSCGIEGTPAPAARSSSTHDIEAPTPLLKGMGATPAHAAGAEPELGPRRGVTRAYLEAAGGPKKCMRMSCHPCGCLVHLLRDTGDVIHVPRMGDFVIGRNPRSCNLTLDAPQVPNMVSRRHAVIVSADDAVMIVDCESVNGTYVNGRRVGRETLRQGDELTVGNPAQSPSTLKFSVSMAAGL